MAESLAVAPSSAGKQEKYEVLIPQLVALTEAETDLDRKSVV